MPSNLQFPIAGRYMAIGYYQRSVADCTDAAQPSTCKYLRIVAKVLADPASGFITHTAPEDEHNAMNHFFIIAILNRCIDGCDIPIQNPGGQNLELCRCRKEWVPNIECLSVMPP